MDASSAEVEAVLVRRGLRVSRKGPGDERLLPSEQHVEGYYRALHRYSFRLFVRDVITHREGVALGDVSRYTGERSAARYIDYLVSVGLLEPADGGYRLARQSVQGFGRTLEWYVAEVLRRELLAPTLSNVRLLGPGLGGDYDVLASLDGRLLYVEAKSSPPKQVYAAEVAAFLQRAAALGPELAVFLVDTRLRMLDKIVPLFDAELTRRPEPLRVERLEREIFHVRGRIFITNSHPAVAANLAAILRAYHAGRSPLL